MNPEMHKNAAAVCDETLLRYIDEALASSGMDPSLLQIEITESMVMLNVDRAVQLLGAIQSRGIRLAIDDRCRGVETIEQGDFCAKMPATKSKASCSAKLFPQAI